MGYDEERKQTHIVRYYGEEGTDREDMWIDVQVLDTITYNGRQWPGRTPQGEINNQFQKTTMNFADYNKDDGRALDTTRVQNPDDDNQYVEIKTNQTIEARSRKSFQFQKVGQSYDNSDDNESRRGALVRVVNNDIDDDHLEDVTDNNGRTTRQPPSDPAEYLNAVQQSDARNDDQSLDVELIDTFGTSRASKFQHQGIQFNGMWNNSLLYNEQGDVMPGSEETSPGEQKPVRLDPLQMVVNFGFGGLAVQFGDKAADAPGDGKGGKR